MLSNLKKSHRILVFVILLILLIALLVFGYVLLKNYSSNKNKEYEPKENEFVFKGYVYQLSGGWQENKNYTKTLDLYSTGEIDGVTVRMGAVIYVHDLSSSGHTKAEIFKDLTVFEERLKRGSDSSCVTEGDFYERNGTRFVIYPCTYDEKSKVLLAYMPAYEENLYEIQFYTHMKVNGEEETVFNYKDLYPIVDILNTGKKIK